METSPTSPLEDRESHEKENKVLVERTCLPFLLHSQNKDGGWSFGSDARSRVEASAWVVLALRECGFSPTPVEAISRAFHFLQTTQLPNGSWPASPEAQEGCWVTALACWALLGREEFSGSVNRGLGWLCADRPGEARLWWRILRGLRCANRVSTQKDSYYGWSWTVGTASWVEPTSALIVLHGAPANLSGAAVRRQRSAEAMLYDRMCPGGGWNCGNPMVYGVPGEPQVSTTAWALLALRRHADRQENQLSLQWLEQAWSKMESPTSLALAHLALDAYGRHNENLGTALRRALESSETPWSIPTVAWTALALCGGRHWLSPGSKQ